MKQGVSSLNPYAAAYIPLSKRCADDRTYVTATESEENPYCNLQDQLHFKGSLDSGAHGSAKQFYGSSSCTFNELAEKQMSTEEFDMDLEFLQMTFTGISDQSLTDVYLANKGDLEATVDMLNQLEVILMLFYNYLFNILKSIRLVIKIDCCYCSSHFGCEHPFIH